MPKKTVAFQLVDALKDLGVKHVFGVPSGGWIDYMEEIRMADGLEFILTSHEGAAGFMADVCGRLTGVPGVCFGTFGPGATNLSTGVGSAQLDRSPMIALSDEMPEAMRKRTTQMGIDHQALFAPLTKCTTRLERHKIKEIVFDAAQLALSDRPGAVHIGLPAGLSGDVAGVEDVVFEGPPEPPTADAALLQKMSVYVENSRKPLIVLGLGALRARVEKQVIAFALAHSIPIILTPMAKGLVSEDHPCYAGVLFHALSDMVGVTHQQADLVIAIGYDPIEFNYEVWLPDAPLISIDTEPADIDQTDCELALDIVGDIRNSVAALSQVNAGPKDWDFAALADRRQLMFQKMRGKSDSFGPCAVLDILRDVLPDDGIMTCDVGAHTHLIGQKWPTPAPGLQIMTNGWSAMGFGIPAAIAAKLCRPDQVVCGVVGDGGFLMSAGELATAARYNIKVVFVLLTDNDLALIRIKQQKKNNPIYGTPVRAQGTIGGKNIFGVPVVCARDADSFRQALIEAFATNGPVIVEAITDSREYDDLVLKKDKP